MVVGERDKRKIVSQAGADETQLTPGQATEASADDAAGAPTPVRRNLAGAAHDASTVHIVAPGKVLNDHYRLVREVARGGMGIVYEAEDVKLEGRRVAIKILPPEVAKDVLAQIPAKFCTL